MIWEWNWAEWTRHNECWRCQENFELRHGYVRESTWKVMRDLRLLTSDGMDDSLWWLWRFLQCLERDWTLSCWSKLLQFNRSESRRVYVSLCLFVRDVWSENVHLLKGNVYVVLPLSKWLSAQNAWYSSWTIVPRGLMNLYFMLRLGYSQVIDQLWSGSALFYLWSECVGGWVGSSWHSILYFP